MDRIEFAAAIKQDSDLLVTYFDSIMALYDLIGQYQGLSIINNSTSAQLKFIIDGDRSNLETMIAYINAVEITRYGIYRCNAYFEGNRLVINLIPV